MSETLPLNRQDRLALRSKYLSLVKFTRTKDYARNLADGKESAVKLQAFLVVTAEMSDSDKWSATSRFLSHYENP